jgi:hypothetical protein
MVEDGVDESSAVKAVLDRGKDNSLLGDRPSSREKWGEVDTIL